MRPAPQEDDGKERHEDDIKPGEEAGIGDGRRQQTHLLGDGAEKQDNADDREIADAALRQDGACLARLEEGKRGHDDGRQSELHRREPERIDLIHRRRLCDEAGTPDGARQKKKQIGLNAVHGLKS